MTVKTANGEILTLDEPYVNFEPGPSVRPNPYNYPQHIPHLVEHTVAKGHVFVCGDNRNHSLDSRYVGDIDARKIVGKAVFRVLPVKSFGILNHVSYEK